MTVYAGLCGACRNARVVESRRGSQFTLCELSRTDDRFPKYPRLPVVSCIGYAPVLDTDATAGDRVDDHGADSASTTDPAPGAGPNDGVRR